MGNLNGWAIGDKLFDWIRQNVSDKSKILEFGSGTGTKELVKFFDVTSVEHDKRWLNIADTNYVYAPIVKDWYDVNELKVLDEDYALVLIDGPPGNIGRYGVLQFYDDNPAIFENAYLICDDTHRAPEQTIVLEFINRGFNVVHAGNDRNKLFTVLKK